MSNNILKKGLAAYPTEHWNAEIDLGQFSKKQIVSALSEILEEHGCFPVPWGTTGVNDGLSVIGHAGSYVGHWNTIEDTAISTASEDLGDVDMASGVIFRTYFSGSDFSHRVLPVIGKRVFRMGIAGNYGLESPDIRWAAEHGANYWLWGASFKKVTAGIKEVISKDREKHVVAMLGWGLSGWQIRKSVEKALRKLHTDYLDVFILGWLGRTSFYSRGNIDTLLKLKDEGKIKTIGTSIHDRKRAGRLALDSEIDLFMIRYNAKHTGAEEDIFPHLKKRNPAVVSYTALAWQQLINPVKGIEMAPWPGSSENAKIPPLTPELCYGFVLSNPHIHLVLTGPKNREQLMSNFRAMQHGPLAREELNWIRDYGNKVRSRKKLDYFK